MVFEQADKFQSLVNVISNRTGLRMRSEDRESWLNVIKSRLKCLKLSTLEEYRQLLLADNSEWRELVGSLTSGETYFFRDKGQFSLIRDWILPELIERRQDRKQLRIWSAGCSTGEEPYSVAIILNELFQNPTMSHLPQSGERGLMGWDILIIGTDINPRAIERAKKGVYTQWSFRMISPDLKLRYFYRRKDKWELDAKIREMVRFKTGNITDDPFPDYASEIFDMDIVLCRNVFIYLSDEAVDIALKKLTGTLAEKGYLITGHGEIHGRKPENLRPVILPESVVYRKVPEPEGRSAKLKITETRERAKITIAKTVTEVSAVAQQRKIKETEFSASASHLQILNSGLDALIDTAESYADTGEYDKAASVCRKAIELDATAIKPYFLLAHVVEAKGGMEEAKQLFKKVIYLEPDFVPAYLELGAVYDNEGESERAEKMRTAALGLLKALPSDEVIEPYKDIAAGELIRYLEKLTGVKEAKV